jgi:cation diffusion facilitator family transporter
MKPPAGAREQPGTTERLAAEKRSAAGISVLAACVMTALKLVMGVLTGSLGMLSDAAHSGLDLLAAALTFVSVRLSDRPADESHTYGHGKIENLSAFTETFLMAVSCVWIVTEALRKIFGHAQPLRFSIWPFLVLLLSIGVDWSRSRALRRAAERSGSPALAVDASHFASDIWSSLAVLAGLAASNVGLIYHLPWLHYADPIAALAVALLILRFSWNLARQTVEALLDAAPPGVRRRIIEAAGHTPGVLSVERVRVRRAGSGYFADLHVAVPRASTLQHTEAIAERISESVSRILPNTDVVVRTLPREANAESIFDKIRAVASRNNVVLHDVSVQSFRGGLHVEQHLEVPETKTLLEAHNFVCELEAQMRQELPVLKSVLTHIESEPATIERPLGHHQDRVLEERLRRAASELPAIVDIHDVGVSRVGERVHLSCHCTLPDDLPMSKVHDIITTLEDRFKMAAPEVYRVLIHPEPATDNKHERRSGESQAHAPRAKASGRA